MQKYFIFILLLKLATSSDHRVFERPNQVPSTLSKQNLQHVTYTAAVLEYEAYREWDEEEKGFGIIRENAENFISYASEAKKQGAEILVTPEYGLVSVDIYHYELEDFLTFAQYVPDPSDKIIPCHMSTNVDNFEGMQMLSCGAKSNDIYLVVDMLEFLPCSADTISKAPWKLNPMEDCPEEGYFFYNTQVVFDRNGMVIARYRKEHLYKEYALTGGPMDDSTAIFITDFNVAFSLQICYDTLFEGPGYSNVKNYGIRDVIMSTAWVDQLPFSLADALHNGWSRGIGTNFIVSGLHYPEHHSMGSGIYQSYSNDSIIYSYDKDSGDVFLIGSINTVAASELDLTLMPKDNERRRFGRQRSTLPKASSLAAGIQINEENRQHPIFHQDLSEFTKVILKPGAVGEVMMASACSYDEFCCDLSYQYTGNEIYMFMVFSGRSFIIHGVNDLGVQQCGVVWCKTSDYETCALIELGLPESDFFGPFEISSSSFKSDLVFPVGNQRNLSLITNKNLEFEVTGNTYSVKAPAPVKNYLSAALFGRWFSKDVINHC